VGTTNFFGEKKLLQGRGGGKDLGNFKKNFFFFYLGLGGFFFNFF